MNKIINGDQIAAKIIKQIAPTVKKLKQKNIVPKLAVILVGADRPSEVYVKKKELAAKKASIDFELYKLPKNISEKKLINKIKNIQTDKTITGLIIQIPLPENLYTESVLNAIRPEIDVDCLTNINLGKLVMGTGYIIPPTPGAIMQILREINVNLAGKNVTIIGTGALVGKPLSIVLINAGASITTCNQRTTNIKQKCLSADIIITGVGQKNILNGDMVKKNAIVIDAGIHFENGKTRGDVNFEQVVKKAKFITPTPHGVGPITVAHLLTNTVICAEKNNRTPI